MSNKFIVSAFLAAATAVPLFATAAEPTPASAEPTPAFTLTGNAALSSEYIFRGIGQTDKDLGKNRLLVSVGKTF